MKYKQLLALVLALALLMAGCGKREEVLDNTTGATNATEESAAATTGSAVEDSDFDGETQPTETEGQTEPTENTEPAETAAPTEAAKPEPSAPTVAPTPPPAKDLKYDEFHNLSAAEQQAFIESFNNLDLFFAWYNQAKDAYEAANPPIDVGDGNVDMGDLIG